MSSYQKSKGIEVKNLSNISGVQLFELSVAISVIMLALLGTFSTIISVETLEKVTSERIKAVLAATAKMEEILSHEWDEILCYNTIPLNTFVVKGLQVIDNKTTHGKIIITTDYENFIHTITIIITWKSFGRRLTLNLKASCSKWQ